MSLKIFDVPDGTEYLVAKDSLAKSIKSVHVSNLDDAPEKRVIELPADLLDRIVAAKAGRNLHSFIQVIHEGENPISFLFDEAIGKQRGYGGDERYNTLGDWYLGHIKFVAKREDNFVLAFPNKVTSSLDMRYLQIINNGFAINAFDKATKLTDADVNELPDKFPEINFDALEKVKVDD